MSAPVTGEGRPKDGQTDGRKKDWKDGRKDTLTGGRSEGKDGGQKSGPKNGPKARRDTESTAGVAVRVAAVRVIEQLLDRGGSLTRLVPEAQSTLPPADRALLQAYAFGLARWSGQLQGVLDALMERPLKAKDTDVRLLIQLGLFQLLHTRTPPHAAVDATVAATRALDKPWARGLVNAVLRNAIRRRDALLDGLDETARLAHPPWLLKRLVADWPNRWQEIVAANNLQAPMTLRVNLARVTRVDYLRRLSEAGREAAPVDALPAALVLETPVPVDVLPGFAAGDVSVQDAGAQLAVAFLIEATAAGGRLLDACAAPGGKTAQALESGHFGEVVAIDRDAERLERVRETLVRVGVEGTSLHAVDAADTAAWWDGTPFEAVLIDAPCTATGVIRRHPDIKLLRRATDVAALVAEQARLLDALWPTLGPGGALLYATCSVLREEGESQIAAFLARRSGVTLVHERRVLPGEGASMDGFYHALLVRGG